MIRNLTLILFLLYQVSTFACLNESRILLNGKFIISDEESLVPYGHLYYQNRKEYEKELVEVYNSWKKEKNIEDYSDYGVILVYLGEYKKALKVFQEIETLKPGLYATAANMGTTYELLGNNKLAYDWIKKGIEIDKNSHDGSE
ncbi:tetratricopeptide repeat protein, partial [Flavobacterium sp. FPG59]|uniref:tetratricopeptide repeat protein n=1 Tax=Flavobacterium sp. FPG59 TaxID=1929267 RepID=UPI000B70DEA9